MKKLQYFVLTPLDGKRNKKKRSEKRKHFNFTKLHNISFREIYGFGAGYVVIPKSHPFYNLTYSEINQRISFIPEINFSQHVNAYDGFFEKYIEGQVPKHIKDYIKENGKSYVIGFHTASINSHFFKKKGSVLKQAKKLAEICEEEWIKANFGVLEQPLNRKERRKYHHQGTIIKPFDISSL